MRITEWDFYARRYYPLKEKYPYIEIYIRVHLDDGRIRLSQSTIDARAYKTEGVFDSYISVLLRDVLTELKEAPDQPRHSE